jgi:hypothetical protein
VLDRCPAGKLADAGAARSSVWNLQSQFERSVAAVQSEPLLPE